MLGTRARERRQLYQCRDVAFCDCGKDSRLASQVCFGVGCEVIWSVTGGLCCDMEKSDGLWKFGILDEGQVLKWNGRRIMDCLMKSEENRLVIDFVRSVSSIRGTKCAMRTKMKPEIEKEEAIQRRMSRSRNRPTKRRPSTDCDK